MIGIKHHGNFKNTDRFLGRVTRINYKNILDRFGLEGVAVLAAATPKDSGKTAESWTYKVTIGNGATNISWWNTNIVNGAPIAILLQYGHGTNGGGYVEGIDYINPALKPIFDKMAADLWKEVTTA